jgi:protein-tyrosine phosphatase
VPLPTDPDCYWVEPGVLLAGEYPGDERERAARRKLRHLLECGVRTFVDLTEEGELTRYDDWLQAEAGARGVDVTYARCEVEDMGVPSGAEMRTILDLLAGASAGTAAYVHCWGGIGRTGTVVCCWLVERGRTAEEALAEIVLLRERTQNRWRPSPEMPGQADFVRRWAEDAGRGDR